MKVTFTTSIAGHAMPEYDLPDFSFKPGDTVTLHDKLAAAWIASDIVVKSKSQATSVSAEAAAPVTTTAKEGK